MAGAWLRRARRWLEGHPESRAWGNLLLREAEQLHGAAELSNARSTRHPLALDLARRTNSSELEAEALQTIGRILIDDGNLRDGMDHLDEAMLMAIGGGVGPYTTGKVYCSVIGACADVGDHRRAAEWTDAASRWAEHHPHAVFPGLCRVKRAEMLERRGDWPQAEREARLGVRRTQFRQDRIGCGSVGRGRRDPQADRRPRRRRGGLRPRRRALLCADGGTGAAASGSGTTCRRSDDHRRCAGVRRAQPCGAGSPAARQSRDRRGVRGDRGRSRSRERSSNCSPMVTAPTTSPPPPPWLAAGSSWRATIHRPARRCGAPSSVGKRSRCRTRRRPPSCCWPRRCRWREIPKPPIRVWRRRSSSSTGSGPPTTPGTSAAPVRTEPATDSPTRVG